MKAKIRLSVIIIIFLFIFDPLANINNIFCQENRYVIRGKGIINDFYNLLLQSQSPTISNSKNIFASSWKFEPELLIQEYRKKHKIFQEKEIDKDIECIKYINERLRSPNEYESLVFRKMRNEKRLIWGYDKIKTEDLIISMGKNKEHDLYNEFNVKHKTNEEPIIFYIYDKSIADIKIENESLLGFTDTTHFEDTRDEIISVFRNYVSLLEDKSPVNDLKWLELYRIKEAYHEYFLMPKMRIAKQLICQKKDEKLLLEFIKVLISDEGSADEEPPFILGEIFLYLPNLIVSKFKKLNNKEKAIIYRQLEWGFLNVTYRKEDSIENYRELKKILDSMKKMVPEEKK